MRETDFVFDSLQLMHFICHRVTFKRGGSYIDTPAWLKNIKAIINPQNGVNQCFQYAAIVALNYQEIETYPERVSNIVPFIKKYNRN